MRAGKHGFFVPDTKRMLIDRSLEIPPFLRRSPDGGFEHPNMAIPLVPVAGATGDGYRAVTAPSDVAAAAAMARAAERDRRAAEDLRRATKEEERAREKQHSKEAAEKRKLDKQRKHEIRMAQRKNFLTHFRWEFDK